MENKVDKFEEYSFDEYLGHGTKVNILDCDDVLGRRNALKDLITLSGVLKDLGNERFWMESGYVLETLRTFNLILRGTHYADTEGIVGPEELVYRYEKEYGVGPEIDIPRLIRLCRKFNWVVDASNGCLRLTADGKRMILSLFRLANDSLDFHLTPSEMKYLYLARRDIELASVYEDKGIGEHDTLSSIVSNLEDAVQDIEWQGDMYIHEGYGLEKYEGVYVLLKILEKEIEDRYNQRKIGGSFIDEDNRLQNLHSRSFLAFQKAFRVLAPFLGDIGYASQFGMQRKVQLIDRDGFLEYLVHVFSGEEEHYTLGPLMVLEQLEYEAFQEIEGEMDFGGFFSPFKLSPLLHEEEVDRGIVELDDWIDHWELPMDQERNIDVEYIEAKRVTPKEFNEIIGSHLGEADELQVDTRPLVGAIRKHSGDYLDKLLKDRGPEWWQAVVNLSMLAILHGEKEVQILPGKDKRKDLDRNKKWYLRYPEDNERFIKATARLGRHLKGRVDK